MTASPEFVPRLMLLACTPLLVIAGGGLAAEIDSAGLFQRLDANHDGRIVAAEAGSERGLLFDRLVRTGDSDGDDRLDAEEFEAALTPIRAEKAMVRKQGNRLPGADALMVLIARMDANGDGRLVPKEVPAEHRMLYDQMLRQVDGDQDGVLDPSELSIEGPRLAGLAMLYSRRQGIDVDAELKKLSPQQRAALEADPIQKIGELLTDPARAPELFDRLDSNGDGAVTQKELPPPLAERLGRFLKRADRNNDKKVGRQEFLDSYRRAGALRGAMMSE